MSRPCDLDHDCDVETWHRHEFADKSGSIRWSTDDLHVASRLVHDALVDVAAPASEDDGFAALNAREPDPELW